MNPRARRAHNPDPDPLDDPRHDPPTDVEVDWFEDMGFGLRDELFNHDWEAGWARFMAGLEEAA